MLRIKPRVPHASGGRTALDFRGEQPACEHRIALLDKRACRRRRLPAEREVEMQGLLVGQHILVVEDEYYLATDTADAIRRAGATVLGPCSNEQDALAQIKSRSPSAALLDINLGLGPTFNIARMLKQNDVPLIFVTGYDAEVIPPEFAKVPRLQKPVEELHIISLLAEILNSKR
jgi:CheY-like chemotaxis protein